MLLVGAGGWQLLEPNAQTKKLVAIDSDAEALRKLGAHVAAQGLQDRVNVIAADFHQVAVHGDAVYFEFCLHEIDDPEKALVHAKSLASDIVVYDHSAGSEWAYYAAEEEKVARSSAAVERFGIRRRQVFRAEQRFAHYAELLTKLRPQGPVAIGRARRFAEATDIVIPMRYELNLL